MLPYKSLVEVYCSSFPGCFVCELYVSCVPQMCRLRPFTLSGEQITNDWRGFTPTFSGKKRGSS